MDHCISQIIYDLISLTGKRSHSDKTSSEQESSVEPTGDLAGSEAKTRLLIPPPIIRMESDDGSTSTASKFIRNGTELRRSLRRINSLTRRLKSPIPPAASNNTTNAGTSTEVVIPKRKNSRSSVAGGEAAATLTRPIIEPEFRSCVGTDNV